jgi:hypothetical protein
MEISKRMGIRNDVATVSDAGFEPRRRSRQSSVGGTFPSIVLTLLLP